MAVEETNFPYYIANRIAKPQTMSQSLPTRGSHYSYCGSSLSSQIFLDLTPTSYVKPDPGFTTYLAKRSKYPLKHEPTSCENKSPEPNFGQFTSWTQSVYLEESVCNEEIVEYSSSFPRFTFLFDQLTEETQAEIAERIRALSGNIETSLNDRVTHIVTTRTSQEVKSFVNGLNSSEALLHESNRPFDQSSADTLVLIRRLQKQGVKLWSLNKMLLVLDQLASTKAVSESSDVVEPVYFNNLYLLVEDTTDVYRPIMADDIIVPADLGSRSPVWDFVIRENPQWMHLLPEDPAQVKKRNKVPRKHKNGKVAPGKLLKLKPKKKATVIKKKKRGYCENCNTLFECMEDHLQEPIHQQLSRDYSRYDDLDSVISGVQRIVIS